MGKKINLIIALLLLITVGVVAYVYMSPRNREIGNTNQTTTQTSNGNKKAELKVAAPTAKLNDTIRLVISLDAGEKLPEGARLFINFNPKILQPLDALPSQKEIKQSESLPIDSNLIVDRSFNKLKGTIIVEFLARQRSLRIGPRLVTAIDFKVVGASKTGNTKIYFDQQSTRINSQTVQGMSYQDTSIDVL